MYLHDQILFVESVAVSPAIQERGVGWARMNYVENVAIQKDVKIQLYTNTKMYKNIAMYQQLGYKVVDTRQEDGYSRFFSRNPSQSDSLQSAFAIFLVQHRSLIAKVGLSYERISGQY